MYTHVALSMYCCDLRCSLHMAHQTDLKLRSIWLAFWHWTYLAAIGAPFPTVMPRRGIKLSARECCFLLWLGLPALLHLVIL